MPWRNERSARKIHRVIGISSVGFLLFMVITGLLWANAPFLYWDPGYKEKVGRVLPAPSLETARVSFQHLFELTQKSISPDGAIETIILRKDFGRLVYEVHVSEGDNPSVILVDALTGERLSPISMDLAEIIARQYVNTANTITDVTVKPYTPRKENAAQDAIYVTFEGPDHATIILDRHTGKILEDESLWRRVHFLVMQLHQLNFFGFNKTLLNIPGIPIFLMAITGLWLWWVQASRKHRARKHKTSPLEFMHSPEQSDSHHLYTLRWLYFFRSFDGKNKSGH